MTGTSEDRPPIVGTNIDEHPRGIVWVVTAPDDRSLPIAGQPGHSNWPSARGNHARDKER